MLEAEINQYKKNMSAETRVFYYWQMADYARYTIEVSELDTLG